MHSMHNTYLQKNLTNQWRWHRKAKPLRPSNNQNHIYRKSVRPKMGNSWDRGDSVNTYNEWAPRCAKAEDGRSLGRVLCFGTMALRGQDARRETVRHSLHIRGKTPFTDRVEAIFQPHSFSYATSYRFIF